PPIPLDKGTLEIHRRDLKLPVYVRPDRAKAISRVALYLSLDRGQTWKYLTDLKPGTDGVQFMAPRDGHYWFAVRVTNKDGTTEPPTIKKLFPGLKLYVNSARRPVEPAEKSYRELEQEVKELRQEVERLRRRVRELEEQHEAAPRRTSRHVRGGKRP